MTSLKQFILTLILRTARRRTWYVYIWHPFVRIGEMVSREHRNQSLQIDDNLASISNGITKEKTVTSGPFAGLRYPSAIASGSTLLPKLLGTYEQELHGAIKQMIGTDYAFVVDIGCAEGYYAIGFAMKMPNTRVIAYDTEANALERCRAMAETNGVLSQLTFESFCTRDILLNLPSQRGLIFCDCEGYEEELFRGGAAGAITNCDLLIEVHEFVHPFILSELRSELGATHIIEVICSVSDWARPTAYPQAQLQQYSYDTQIVLMSELRPPDMLWLWCRSKEVQHLQQH